MIAVHSFGSRCQVWGTRRMTGASTSLEWTTISDSSLHHQQLAQRVQHDAVLEQRRVDGECFVLASFATGITAVDVCDVQQIGLQLIQRLSDMSSIESHRCRFDNDSHYTVFDHVMKKSALLPLPHVGHGDQSQTIASTEKGIGKGLHVFDARSLIIRQNGTRRNTFDLRKAFLRVRRNTRNAPWSLSEQHIGLLPRLHSWDCTTTLNRCTCP